MCVKIAAMVRALPGGLALQAVGSRMFDKNLVHAIVGDKDLDRGSAERISLKRLISRRQLFLIYSHRFEGWPGDLSYLKRKPDGNGFDSVAFLQTPFTEASAIFTRRSLCYAHFERDRQGRSLCARFSRRKG
jgi:hypothetical protein